MDREQEEMQFLGVFGIYQEACKIIISWRKIFTQITLTSILPLSLIFLAHIEVSDVLSRKIWTNEMNLDQNKVGTPKYDRISDHISSEVSLFWLFKAAYFTFLLIFSLLSTSAVVYTIACIYTSRQVSYSKVMSVVPKVWKRLMVTFLWYFLAFFLYHVLVVMLFVLWVFLVAIPYHDAGFVTFIILLVLYFVGALYLTLIWQFSSVVSVLEDVRGMQALNKSKALTKGKMWLSIFVFLILGLLSYLLQFAFQKLVVHGWRFGLASRVGYGVLSLLGHVVLMLFGLVIQTILYFVCKSYHHENIDKSALSDHLEVYLGEYVPLKAKDVQLEHSEV
ncbi:hypothetical protein UlMin_021290 [Ulmus minor]